MSSHAKHHAAPERRLRILHVVEAFGGGVFEVVRWIAQRHSAEGHTVAIAYGVRPETPTDLRAAMGTGTELICIWPDRSLKSHIGATRTLRRLAVDWSPDIVHLHSSFGTIIGALSLPPSMPSVASPHAYSFTMEGTRAPVRHFYRMAEQMAARRLDHIGAVSKSEADIARTALGVSHVSVVANGIPELDSPDLPRRDLLPARVVAMGRAERQRQPDICARVLDAVRDIAEVEWIGGGSTTETGIESLHAHRIPVSGWVDRDTALSLLGSAGAYLHYTAWDGQPLSILEAMARDVAVVASDIPANREVLGRDLVCATPEAAIEMLRKLLIDREYAAHHLAVQRERRGYYGADRMAGDWLTVYRSTIAEKGNGGCRAS